MHQGIMPVAPLGRRCYPLHLNFSTFVMAIGLVGFLLILHQWVEAVICYRKTHQAHGLCLL